MADTTSSVPTITGPEPAHNVLSGRRRSLEALFRPNSVAVIGATERPGSVGRTLMRNLLGSPFGGTVYPVNPGRSSVLGVRCYEDLDAIPESVDLALIATPARTVPDIVRNCRDRGVQGVIIISAGFREAGEEGRRLEEEVASIVEGSSMRIVGPNCLGVMRPVSGLNATFAAGMAQEGQVAFVSQSGALMTAILDWSYEENVGFSTFVSMGSMLDVGWGDMIDYLGDDPHTDSILLYIESIDDARSFLSAAREVARNKPIIVIKAGRTEQAAEAASSHTGAMTGSDEVLTAAFRRSGVTRVDSIADLFYTAEVLAKQPRPRGPNLTILTNAGGPGVLATDALVGSGGELAELSEETRSAFDGVLPAAWSGSNPVDILGDADPERYARSVDIALEAEESDGLLVVLTPQDMTDPTQTANRIGEALDDRRDGRSGRQTEKPVLASWMGGSSVEEAEQVLNDRSVPTFSYPDTATRVFNYTWQYSYNLKGLYETPRMVTEGGAAARRQVEERIRGVLDEGRTLLSEHESKEILQQYEIPVTETRLAETEEAAVSAAEALGYPVVLKLHSHTISHKSDVGGVRLDLRSEETVRSAFRSVREATLEAGGEEAFGGVTLQPMVETDGFELILGSSTDRQFGPVLLFGSGGTMVEVYEDRALALPPLNTTLARRMMEQTKVFRALQGFRGKEAVDLDELTRVMVRFSRLVAQHRWIKEIDLNPLLASGPSVRALDARIVLHEPDTEPNELPRLAIRPYPHEYADRWDLEDGTEVQVRPIRPEDEPRMRAFHEKLSTESVYLRYAGVTGLNQRVAHERLSRLCHVDYDREMALVVQKPGEESDPASGGAAEDRPIWAVGRLSHVPGTGEGEFALLVADPYQDRGIGTRLLRRLVEVGRREGLDRIVGYILKENRGMQHVAEKLGFELREIEGDRDYYRAVRELEPAEQTSG